MDWSGTGTQEITPILPTQRRRGQPTMRARLLAVWILWGIAAATAASAVLGTGAALVDRNLGESWLRVIISGATLGLIGLGVNLLWFVPSLVSAMLAWMLMARFTAVESSRAVMLAGLAVCWALACAALFGSVPTAWGPESFQMATLAAALIVPRMIVSRLRPGAFAA